MLITEYFPFIWNLIHRIDSINKMWLDIKLCDCQKVAFKRIQCYNANLHLTAIKRTLSFLSVTDLRSFF